MPIGAVVLPPKTSPLAALLGGLGTGMSSGFSQAMQRMWFEKEQKKSMLNQLLQGMASGQFDPRMLATDAGKAWMRSMGVDKNTDLTPLIEGGMESMTPPRPQMLPGSTTMPGAGPMVNVPQSRPAGGVPVQDYIKQRREEAFNLEMNKRAAELTLEKDINKAYEKTPEEIAAETAAVAAAMEKRRLTPTTVTGGGVTALTPFALAQKKAEDERQAKIDYRDEQKFFQAFQNDYETLDRGAAALRGDYVKVVSSVMSGELTQYEIFAASNPLLAKGMEKNKDKFKYLKPIDRANLIIKQFNEVSLPVWNRQLKDSAKRARLKEYTRLEPLNPRDFDPNAKSEEPPATNETRGGIVTPPPIIKKDEEKQKEADIQSAMKMKNPITGKLFTRKEAEDLYKAYEQIK